MELLLVLVVISVLSSIVWASVARSRGSFQVRAASGLFTETHALARATAIRFGRVATLRIDPGNRRFWAEADTGGGAFTVGTRQELGTNVTLSSPATHVCFDGRGLRVARGSCTQDTVAVSVSASGASETLRIMPGGEVVR